MKETFSISFSLKEIPGCPNKECNVTSSTFIRISGLIAEVKKTALTNDWESIANWQESEQSEVLRNKFSLSQIQLGGLRELWNEETFVNFLHF